MLIRERTDGLDDGCPIRDLPAVHGTELKPAIPIVGELEPVEMFGDDRKLDPACRNVDPRGRWREISGRREFDARESFERIVERHAPKSIAHAARVSAFRYPEEPGGPAP